MLNFPHSLLKKKKKKAQKPYFRTHFSVPRIHGYCHPDSCRHSEVTMISHIHATVGHRSRIINLRHANKFLGSCDFFLFSVVTI